MDGKSLKKKVIKSYFRNKLPHETIKEFNIKETPSWGVNENPLPRGFQTIIPENKLDGNKTVFTFENTLKIIQ